MLFPWNLVSLHRFKRISLFLSFEAIACCLAAPVYFLTIFGVNWLDFCLCFGFLWLSGKKILQNTYRSPPYIIFPFPVPLC